MKPVKIFCFAALCALSCATADNTAEKTDYVSSTKKDYHILVDSISQINDSAPAYYNMIFTIEGLLNKQKYKLNGNAQLDAKLNRICLSLTDFIFKSPISTMFANNDDIIMYFPTEKKLFKYGKNSIDLKSLWNISIGKEIIYALASCKIPLIDNYKIKESVVSPDGKTSYLIVENRLYYETVSFKNNMPDKIKIMDKNSRDETDIYLSGAKKYDNSLIYKKISVISKKWNFEIKIDSIKVNTPVKVKTLGDIKIPLDVISISG
jgi:hypothetical protein